MFPFLNKQFINLNKCCGYLGSLLPVEKLRSAKYDNFMLAKLINKMFSIIKDIKENNLPNEQQVNVEGLCENKKVVFFEEENYSSENMVQIFEERDKENSGDELEKNDSFVSDEIVNTPKNQNNMNMEKEKEKSPSIKNYNTSHENIIQGLVPSDEEYMGIHFDSFDEEKKSEEDKKLTGKKREGLEGLIESLKNTVNPDKTTEKKLKKI